MKTLLVGINLQHRAFNGSNQALPWLASALHNEGFNDVKQFDMENPHNTLEDLLWEGKNADLIGFCGTFSISLAQIDMYALALRNYLRDIGKSQTPIIVGGYGASGVGRYAKFAPSIDGFFYGPGIEGIVNIARATASGKFEEILRSGEIKGLSYFDKKRGLFVKSTKSPLPSREKLDGIDQLFDRSYIPAIHDMDVFLDNEGIPLPTFQMVTELGCNWSCTFCSESGGNEDEMMFRGVRGVSLETIAKTFEKAKREGYKAVYFDIETAFSRWGRMKNILKMMNDYGFVGGLNTRVDTATEERIKICSDLGVVYQFYGVEHLNPQVLFAVDKFIQADQRIRAELALGYKDKVEQTYRWMNAQGIQSSLFMIMGLPKISNKSWQELVYGDEKVTDLKYTFTSFEDDRNAIVEGFRRANPRHFNANILRFNPDTKMAYELRYALVRPSGIQPIDAAWFVPRVANLLGLKLQDYHPVYRFFEGVETNQPFSSAMNPDRAYATMKVILDMANQTGTRVYFDPILEKAGIISKEKGNYVLKGSLNNFEQLGKR